jgi:hypothetical protein
MTIYLYKKIHNKTGLKYLGKTVQDPYKYKGSGVIWTSHIIEHGYDVTTEILKECCDQEELKYWGKYYSKLWNIVENNDWANLIPESGGGSGFPPGVNHSGKNNPMYGKNHSDFIKKASSLRRAKSNSERKWYNNGVETAFLKECPDGWVKGRINQKPTTAGRRWYNNGIIAVSRMERPEGNDWVLGMLSKR